MVSTYEQVATSIWGFNPDGEAPGAKNEPTEVLTKTGCVFFDNPRCGSGQSQPCPQKFAASHQPARTTLRQRNVVRTTELWSPAASSPLPENFLTVMAAQLRS